MSDETGNAPQAIHAPWKTGIAYGAAGLVFAGLLYLAPHLRWLPLPGGTMIPLALVAMVVPLAAMGWIVAGFALKRHRRYALLAIGIAVALAGLGACGAAFWFDDLRPQYFESLGLNSAAATSSID